MTRKEIEELKIKRVGETRTMNNGEVATIIEYNKENNVIVKFSNGGTKRVSYTHFVRGEVKSDCYYDKFIGEESVMTNGMKSSIISYRNCDDIDIQFEDGEIVTTTYYHFKNGSVKNPNVKTRMKERMIDYSNIRVGSSVVLQYIGDDTSSSVIKRLWKCKCDCGNDFITNSNVIRRDIKQGHNLSCGCKINQKYIYNSLEKEKPYLVKYLKNNSDKLLSLKSNNSILLLCPSCGYEKVSKMSDFSTRGFCCPNCSDKGVSSGEKFVRELLKILGIEFLREKRFEWSDNKRYDFYLPTHNCIIEIHGRQHYDEKHGEWSFTRSLKSEQENDEYKERLAKENGISKYIVINNKLESNENMEQEVRTKLTWLFDSYNFDYNKLYFKMNESLVDYICSVWNSLENKNITNVMKETRLSRRLIKENLKLETTIGLCEYDEMDANLNHLDTNRRKVKCVELNMTFRSMTDCSKYFKENLNIDMQVYRISKSCKNKNANTFGYTFEYA